MTVTVNFVFDTRKIKKDNTYPVKLSIYHDGKKKLYNSGQSFSRKEWEKINSEKLRDEQLKKNKQKLNDSKAKAEKIIESLQDFSFNLFEKEFLEISVYDDILNVYSLFDKKIRQLREEDRIGSALAYETAKTSFQRYKSTLFFTEITEDFLRNYQKASERNGLSSTSQGIYLRHLRAIYNLAINKKLIESKDYPFKNFTIPRSKNIKKTLSESDIKKLFNCNPTTHGVEKALAFWRFSYLVNGINIADIANLKYKNIQNGTITFYRSKTIRTNNSNKKVIKASLLREVVEIINRYGNKPEEHEFYIFPIINDEMNSETKKQRIKNFNRNISKRLSALAHQLNIDGSITNLTARHSFASTLKRKGVSMEFTSDALGHSNLQTTENYLASFEDSTVHEYAKLLVDFK
ncbi:MAG TPA: site-specific integrase [Panacibacter sp.]|nr:site-specific integrase [Panacibacter sp.]